jgi:hypothetical protein
MIHDGQDRNRQIGKIGKTTVHRDDTRKIARLASYNAKSIQHLCSYVPVEHVDAIEKEIKKEFRKKYKLVRGSEWFEGNLMDMQFDVMKVIMLFQIINANTETKTSPSVTMRHSYNLRSSKQVTREAFEHFASVAKDHQGNFAEWQKNVPYKVVPCQEGLVLMNETGVILKKLHGKQLCDSNGIHLYGEGFRPYSQHSLDKYLDNLYFVLFGKNRENAENRRHVRTTNMQKII